MTQPLYDIYYTGQLVEGANQELAQKHLAKLFKTNVNSIAKLFNGKPQVLKRAVTKSEALKYKAALHKAGLLVAFKTHQSTTKASTQQNTQKVSPNTTITSSQRETIFSLAPLGSDVLNDDEKHVFKAREIDTHKIKLVSVFASPSIQDKNHPPAPDTNHIHLANVGEDLRIDLPEPPAPLQLNLDALSLAPVGVDLEQIHDNKSPVTPNISGISIAPVGSALMPNKSKKSPPTPPNTDHLSIL